MAGVNFGTYHHSTPEESRRIREYAEKAFSNLLRPLYPLGAALKILDAGCGLGFLTYVAARCFPEASVIGVDLFTHSSISEISIEGAVKNMKSLGVDSRISFLKHDLLRPLGSNVQYDLAVSNLVFHNMGKKRFEAYGTVFDVLKPTGYFVIGDLFAHGKADMDYFRERSTLANESDAGELGRSDYKIEVFRKRLRSRPNQPGLAQLLLIEAPIVMPIDCNWRRMGRTAHGRQCLSRRSGKSHRALPPRATLSRNLSVQGLGDAV
jgi:SAM-dependent methyltransferase